MKSVVIYESIYGNTHLVADAIAAGLREAGDVTVVPVHEAGASVVDDVDLVVVGGPTHVHGMSRDSTRKAGIEAARKPESGLTIDADAEGTGVRDWLQSLPPTTALAAAFDTRIDAPAPFTGRASKSIAKQLRDHGHEVIAEQSFLIAKGKDVHLEPDEETRARAWGASLAEVLAESRR
jgi:Flavodoxin domain